MKKHTLYILIILLLPFNVKSQYYSLINKAEKYIIKENYDSAVFFYNKVVDLYGLKRSVDCYNYTLVNTILGNTNIAFQYIDSCIVRGYSIKYFESIFFQDLRKNDEWNLLENNYNSLYNIFHSQFESDMYIVLNNLVTEDQNVASKTYLSDSLKIVADSVYYLNGQQLIRLIKNDSIPQYDVFNFENINIRSRIPWVLVRHYFGLVNRALSIDRAKQEHQFYLNVKKDSLLFKLLLALIDKGDFSPFVFRDGLVYSNPINLYGETKLKYYQRYRSEDNGIKIIEELCCREKYSVNEISFFNENRKKIGLPTFEDEIEIALYRANCLELYGDNFKYWFQLSKGPRSVAYQFKEETLKIEKEETLGGWNVTIMLGDKDNTIFLSDSIVVEYNNYE